MLVFVLLTRCLVYARYIDMSKFDKERRTTKAEVQEHSNGKYLHTHDWFDEFLDDEEDDTSNINMRSRGTSDTTVSSVVDHTKPLPKTLTQAIGVLQRLGDKYADWKKRVIALAREAVQSITTETASDATITITTKATTNAKGCTEKTTPLKCNTRRPRPSYVTDIPAFGADVQPNLVDGLIGYLVEWKAKLKNRINMTRQSNKTE